MPEFKDMLKYFRMREKLSQSELADKLGMSASRISMYEAGKREPDFETEEKIADFFNTDLNTLRGRDVETHESPIIRAFSGGISSELITQLTKKEMAYVKLSRAVELFESLSDIGQDMVIANMELIKKVHPRIEEPALLNAAHADGYTNAPEELKKQEEDIMNDEDF